MGNEYVETHPDICKTYICYFCEDEIVFADGEWRHRDGEIRCVTSATPSNLTVD